MKWMWISLVLVVGIGIVLLWPPLRTQREQDTERQACQSDTVWYQYKEGLGWQEMPSAAMNAATFNICDVDSLCAFVGSQVSVEGVAESHKIGTLVQCNGFGVWIDKLSDWPEAVSGKKVQAVGVLEERYDLPVFVPEPGGLLVQGIAVPQGTDLHQASRRFVLRDAVWALVQGKGM